MPNFSIITSSAVSPEAVAASFAKMRELLPALKDVSDAQLASVIDEAFDHGVSHAGIRSFYVEGNYADNNQRYGGDTMKAEKGDTFVGSAINYILQKAADSELLLGTEVHFKLTGEIIPLPLLDMESVLRCVAKPLQAQVDQGNELAIELTEGLLKQMVDYGDKRKAAGDTPYEEFDDFSVHTASNDTEAIAMPWGMSETSETYADFLFKLARHQHLAKYPLDNEIPDDSTIALFQLSFFLNTWAGAACELLQEATA